MNEITSIVATEKDGQRWWLLFGVSVASFLGCIDFTIVNTVIPAIQIDLHASVNQSQWIISIFLIALCACMVVAGRLADRYGRRRLLYLGMGIFGASSLGAGLAANVEWLTGFRLIQGVSCAALYTASAAIVSNAFPESERGRAIGILFGVNGIGLAIGPVLGGMLSNGLGWRSVFLVNIPVVLLSFAVCLCNVRESRNLEEDGNIDWPGMILLVIAVTTLMLSITQGMEWGWTSSRTLVTFGIAVMLFIILVRVERVASSPLLRIDLFLNIQFVAASIATSCLAFFYCSAFFLMPLYLKVIGHFDGFVIGIMLLPTTAVMALTSPAVGRMADRYGAFPLVLAGFLLLGLSAVVQAHFDNAIVPTRLVTAFALMGLGWACILAPSTIAALGSVSERLGGVAMGASWTLHNLGGAVGLSLVTIVYQVYARNWFANEAGGDVRVSPDAAFQMVSDPLSAAARLSAATGIPRGIAENIVARFFVQGYQASMWMLCALSLLAAGTICVCTRMRSRVCS